MEKQLTAVEWLIKQFKSQKRILPEHFAKALEMEKQQIIDAYTQAAMKDNKLPYGIQYYGKLEEVSQEAEYLYNKTFNKS